MAKAIFIGTFIILFGGIALLFAATLGLLPASMYSFFYTVELRVPFLSSSLTPYLEQYEGNWKITLEPASDAVSEIAPCDTLKGLLHVHNGAFTGNIGPFGAVLPVQASTTWSGTMTGAFGGTTLHVGEFRAALKEGEGQGTWTDNYGCRGTVALEKQDPVIDPTAGHVVSVQGDVEYMRGEDEEESLLPGFELYAGDVIVTKVGNALLSMGEGGVPVSVPANTTYTVPR